MINLPLGFVLLGTSIKTTGLKKGAALTAGHIKPAFFSSLITKLYRSLTTALDSSPLAMEDDISFASKRCYNNKKIIAVPV
jgi:hypothetical protein